MLQEHPEIRRDAGTSVRSAEEDHCDQTTYSGYSTKARTDFKPCESDDPEKYERLKRHNDGNVPQWNGTGTSKRLRRIDKKRVTQSLCSQARVNPGEKDRVLHVITRLDFTKFGQHRSLRRVALGCIAVVVETRRPNYGAGYEQASIHRQEEYKSLMEDAGIDYKALASIKRAVREQIGESP